LIELVLRCRLGVGIEGARPASGRSHSGGPRARAMHGGAVGSRFTTGQTIHLNGGAYLSG